MAPNEDDRTRLWRRVARPDSGDDPIQALRACIAQVRAAPGDDEARRQLRAVAAAHGLWDQLAGALADEIAATDDDAILAALLEELADVHENLDQPVDTIGAMERLVDIVPDDALHHDRLARLYHQAGAWLKAAEAFERVAGLTRDDRGRAALRAAARLYRDHAQPERAAAMFRAIVARRPTDLDAWRALDQLYVDLGRWREVAEVRGELAARTTDGVEKAALLRAQARAVEHTGDAAGAAELLAASAGLAPEAVSGVIDYADILAAGGKGREAAELLATRIADAIGIGAPALDVAALRLRLAGILDDDCADPAAADAVLDKLFAQEPGYLPALERVAARAARGSDPEAHAAALLRYAAALPDDPARAAVLVEAGRRLREAGDRTGAARALEAACAIVPDDADARRELAAARAVVAVERAAARAAAGEVDAAERELRAVLADHPHDVDAVLALGQILADTGRFADAAEHLRAALADIPDAVPGDREAIVVHRYAIVVAALGEADAAHQLLHEAHRLDRKNLTITLALGDSCFARKQWREAAIHLGSLADHPEAPRHATAVAAGLVRAAQADARALRAASAEQRYAAAARLDPACAPAWHGLAEIATERGDLEGAAEYLEREASATTEPRDRLRLYEALGDLAHGVLDDLVRAERCWIQVAGLGSAAVLDKLLAVQRRRGAGIERAETCQHLAELRDGRARDELLEEAAETFSAGGDHPRARACADRLIAAHPLAVDAVACASAVALAAGDHDAAAAWLGRALTAWDGAGDPGDGDPRRAELWRRLGDARRGRGDAAGARPAYERAIATAAESDGAHAARRGLVELARAGDHSVAGNLAELVAVDPTAADVLAWARECTFAGDPGARPLLELARALGAELAPGDAAFLAAHPRRIIASDETYAQVLDPAERRALVDDAADAPLAGVLEALWEAASLAWPNTRTALADAGFGDAERVSSASPSAVAALYPQIAKALDGPTTVVYATARRDAPDLSVIASAPPIVVIGPGLAAIRAESSADRDPDPDNAGSAGSDAALRFQLGRIVELVRDRRVLAASAGPDGFPRLLDTIWHAFGRTDDAPIAAAETDRLRAAVPLLLRRRLGELLGALGRQALDATAYLAACNRAADRSGLLACGDVGVAIAGAGGADAALHVVRLAASPRYHAARAIWWSPLRR